MLWVTDSNNKRRRVSGQLALTALLYRLATGGRGTALPLNIKGSRKAMSLALASSALGPSWWSSCRSYLLP